MKKSVKQSLKRGLIIFMMMKVLYLFCIINVTASVTSLYSQKTRLSIDIENERLETVLATIEKETDFFFFYKNEELAQLNPVTVKRENISIHDVMDHLLAKSGLTYKIIDEYIAIVPATSKVAGTFQQERISGLVRDTDGVTIPGVTVMVKNKPSTGVVTDLEGRFSITAKTGEVLLFSFVGMTPREVKVADDSFLDIIMEESTIELDDVIVIAYGTTKRETFTGSATVISSDQLSARPVASFTDVIGANTTGVNVYSSGQPGSMPTIRIRGVGSMNASNAPLYIIDGIATSMTDITQIGSYSSGPMSTINPNDIASMTILKDAAAASLYGSRAANGVIVITTKQGREGKVKFNLDVQHGVSEFLYGIDRANKDEFAEIWSTAEMHYRIHRAAPTGMDGYEYIKQVYNDPLLYDSYLQDARSRFNNAFRIEGQVYDFWGDGYDKYPDVNWMDEVSTVGSMDKINLSSSGGQNGLTYFVSGEYFNAKAPIKTANLSRYSGRINLTSKSHKKLWYGINMNFSYTNQQQPQNGWYYANPYRAGNNIPPVVPVYNEDGTYNENFPYNLIGNYNPVLTQEKSDFGSETYREMGTAWVQYNIMDNLSLKTTLGIDNRQVHEFRFLPPGVAQGRALNGVLYNKDALRRRITSSTILNYAKTISDVHNVSALIGWEAEDTKHWQTAASAKEYQTGFTPVLSAGSVVDAISGSDYSFSLLSAFGRAEYNYNNKYYASFSFRRDGSSMLPAQTRWGNFYSVSGAWRISEESFLSNPDWIDDAKFRASYGINGTLPSSIFSYVGNYVFGNDYYNMPGAAVRNVENLNLTWEKSNNLNIGAELTIFNGRIFASIEYYNRYSADLLLDRELSRVTGYTTATVNLGALRNKGFEIELNTVPVKREHLTWNLTLNLSTLNNKIEILPTDDVGTTFIRRQGYSITSWYLPEWAGIDKETGEPRWYRVDEVTGDKEITKNYSEATRVILGTRLPAYSGGLNSSLTYKNFELSFLLSFATGFKVYDYHGALYIQDDGNNRSYNKERTLLDSWRPDNTGSDNPLLMAGVKNGSNHSSRYLYDGNYLKLKNFRLNYTLPKAATKFFRIEKMQIFAQGENLYLLTHMPSFDPETTIDGLRYMSNWPTQRTVSFGISMNF